MFRLLVLFAAIAVAQVEIGGDTFTGNPLWSNLCGKTTADANATGIYSFNPNVSQLQQAGQPNNTGGTTLPVAWLGTLSQTKDTNNASLEWGMWFSTNGANYSNDFALAYDVCAYSIQIQNNDWYRRAQLDDGDCTAAFDQECVDDILDLTKTYAMAQTFNETSQKPRDNLTWSSVFTVCDYIGEALTYNFPSSCNKFMNYTTPLDISGGAWTSMNYSTLYHQCSITDDSSGRNQTFHHVANFDKYDLNNPAIINQFYNVLNYFTIPLLTVFMPVANAQAPVSITEAVADLRCVRANHVQGDSRQPSKAPTPTAYPTPGLSGGAIAGIVIGVLAGVALIAGAAFFFLRRRRRQAKKLETFDPVDPGDLSGSSSGGEMQEKRLQLDTTQEHKPAVEADSATLRELSPDAQVSSPGSRTRPAELEGEEDAKVEKEATAPVELP